jgi:hypothetical protein
MGQQQPIDRREGFLSRSARRYRDTGRGSFVTFGLIAIALVLAIAFFYITKIHDADKRADIIAGAAGSADNAATTVGEAAKNAVDALRRNH